MNQLYGIAIIEGYFSAQPFLPEAVKEAIAALKASANPPVKAKRKYRMTPEQREKNRLILAEAREKVAENRKAKAAA